MTRAADPRIGTDLGSYRIEAVIGRGGMGVVYRAEQLGLARKVALKILAPVLVDDEAFRQRFVRESQMAAAIDHPNILPIYEAGEVDGIYFLAMRYVDGADLETRLRSGPLEPPQAVRLMGQVASALDAAGEAGLVHRDVKPANILIASSRGIEKADHAYLSDFGLTKHRGSQTGLTQTGAFMGTLDYVAPEQVEGRQVDSRTDQYSLACVAFHCLTGATPFARDTDIAIAMAHLHDPPPSASAIRPELPVAVDTVLAKGMAKRPDDRYPTSEAFALSLREVLGVRVSEPHPIPPKSAAARTRRLAVALALGVVAIVAVGAVGFALVGRGSLSPGASPSADTGHAGAFPGAAEAALVARLPSNLRGGCIRGSYAAQPNFEQANSSAVSAPEPDASVICTLPTGADAATVYLQIYPATSAGDAFVRGRVDAVADQIEAALPGDCASKDEARGRWSSGDIVCYQAPQYPRAWIYWTDPSIDLLGAVSREDLDSRALYRWWRGAAGTIHASAPTAAGSPRASPTNESFPTLLESKLTLSLPEASVGECMRGDAALLTMQQGPSVKPRAHVVCQMIGGTGPDVVEAWLLPQLTDMRGSDIIAAMARASGIDGGDCATDGIGSNGWDIPGTDTYGQYLCRLTADGKGAEFDWSIDDPGVVYRAVQQAGDQAALFDWWNANHEAISP
ncbi:MAG TPA: serine/threonine-protein kinase [Candidatus Saccharimonadia bacterium]|nr:serine/threonine-protein kinase [Candidatus Saccharimonadia bacterium]